MVGDIFQPTHLLFVLVVALLVLGPKRLPEVGRTLGSGIRDFRQALSGEHDRSERQYADEPGELAHQPDTSAAYDTDWQPEPVDTPHADFGAAEDSTHQHVADSSSAPDIGATPEQDLAFSEHELARQTAESGRSPEPEPEPQAHPRA